MHPGKTTALLAALFVAACGGSAPPAPASKPVVVAKPPPAPDPDAWRAQQPMPGPLAELDYPVPEVATLPNGVSVYVVRQPAGIVTLSVVARGGAASLPEGKSGLAALAARMMTEGTTRRSSLALAEAAESMGGALEQDAERDSVRIGIEVLREDLGSGLALLAEVAETPAFAPAELERVRKEWLDSLEGERQSPNRLSSLVGLRLLLGKVRGAPVSGSRTDVKKLARSDLVAFHAEAFRPDNLGVFVVGDVTLADALPRVTELFGKWKVRGARKAAAAEPARESPGAATPASSTQVYFVDRPGAVQSALFLAQPFPKRADPDHEAREVMNNLLGGLFTSRINTNLREKHAYTYGARSLDIATRTWGAFAVMTSVRTDVTAEALVETLTELRELRDPALGRPVQPLELERARVDLTGRLGASLAHTSDLGGEVEELFVQSLVGDYHRKYPLTLKALDTAAVSKQAERLTPDGLVVVVVGDRNSATETKLAAVGFKVSPIDETFTD